MKFLSRFAPLILCIALAGGTPANSKSLNAADHFIYGVTTAVQVAPTNLTALPAARNLIGGGRADFVILRWHDNSTNEWSFRVERCAGSTCTNFVEIAKLPPNTVQYYDRNLPYHPGKAYRYRVRARGPNGYSAYTNIVTAKLAL